MKVAVVGGAGRMGMWCARFLQQDSFDVTLIDIDANRLAKAHRQLELPVSARLDDVRHADLVLLAVPLGALEQVVPQLRPHLHAGQKVLDISSLKVPTLDFLEKHLQGVQVLGVHPMFGPGADDIRGRNVIITPFSVQEGVLEEEVGRYLAARGARVTVLSPSEHDQVMGLVLGLPSFVAVAAGDTLANAGRLATLRTLGGTTFRLLLLLVEAVLGQDQEVYRTIQFSSSDVRDVSEQFRSSVNCWADMLARRDESLYAHNVSQVQATLSDSDPDFETAYRRMYDVLDALDRTDSS